MNFEELRPSDVLYPVAHRVKSAAGEAPVTVPRGGMVRSMGVNLKDVRLSGRRVAAVAVAIGVHLGLLIVLLRPAQPASTTDQFVEDKATSLELSFISSPPTTSSSLTPQDGRRVAPASEPVRSRIRSVRAAVGNEASVSLGCGRGRQENTEQGRSHFA